MRIVLFARRKGLKKRINQNKPLTGLFQFLIFFANPFRDNRHHRRNRNRCHHRHHRHHRRNRKRTRGMANSNNPTTRAIRAANTAKWTQQQRQAGATRITVLLPAEDAARLATLAKSYGTKTAAICAALKSLSGEPDQPSDS